LRRIQVFEQGLLIITRRLDYHLLIADSLSRFEEALVQQRIVSPVSIDHYDVDAGYTDLRAIVESIIDELTLHRHFETTLLLLQLRNDVLHVLLNLILLLNFESILSINSQLRMVLIFLLAD
jgi:hypothetical protein